jgi:hypothetical protein
MGAAAGSSLERNPEDLLQSGHVVGVSSDEEARKGMQSGEPRIAGGDAVLTCGFQEGKEAADPIGSDVGNFQRLDRPYAVCGSELQEQDQAVAIALDRMAAHAAERRKVPLEEADDRPAKAGRLIRLPADTSPDNMAEGDLEAITCKLAHRRYEVQVMGSRHDRDMPHVGR